MNRILAFALLLPAASLLWGCGNACQQLCGELLNYAEDDCGLAVQQDDRSQCRERQSRPSAEELDSCQWGLERVPVTIDGRERNVPRVRLEWTCEELEVNVLGGSAGDDDSAE